MNRALHILFLVSEVFHATGFLVYQYPLLIEVQEGANVTFHCLYTSHGNHSVGLYRWYKNAISGTEVFNASQELSDRVFRTDPTTFTLKKNASIMIQEVREADAGVYFCEVELVSLGKVHGKGTSLVVGMRGKTKTMDCKGKTSGVGILTHGAKLLLIFVMSVALLRAHFKKKKM